jgi:hypothetical protein
LYKRAQKILRSRYDDVVDEQHLNLDYLGDPDENIRRTIASLMELMFESTSDGYKKMANKAIRRNRFF